MDLGTVLNEKNAVMLGSLLLPILVIGGLILMWWAIIFICLNIVPALPGGRVMVS